MTEFQRGVIPLARYQEQQLPEYQDNPLISALPPIPDLQEVVGLMQQLPSFEPQEALLDGRLRAHAIARLLHGFFQPLSREGCPEPIEETPLFDPNKTYAK